MTIEGRFQDRENMGGGVFARGVFSLGYGSIVDTSGPVVIGNGVDIGDDVHIYTHEHDKHDRTIKTQLGLEIGDGAWICSHSIILPRCRHIGAGAVIGAGSVVTKDVPAGETWAGNPARRIGVLD